nr:MAG TPA: hypothetical protein [Herelleviridae sp.]
MCTMCGYPPETNSIDYLLKAYERQQLSTLSS